MHTTLRRIIVAGAGLAALALLLWYRLDPAMLRAHIAEQAADLTGSALHIRGSRISFMHGIGLRLDGVRLTRNDFRLQADHIDVGVHLLPLLLGKIELSELTVNQGIITLPPSSIMAMSVSRLSTLPVERLQMVRCRLQTDDGRPLLDNIHLDLRDIGTNREALWELQAEQGEQALRGHGRLDFRRGEIVTGFGKLKLTGVHAAALQPFVPQVLGHWLTDHGNRLSGTLTLDITGREAWALFGEMQLQSDHYDQPLHLRGKISHPDRDHLAWRDSFIHFDAGATIAIEGGCLRDGCQSRITADHIPLKAWLPLLSSRSSLLQQLTALTDINGELRWQPSGWQASARLRISRPAYGKDNRLPDMLIEHLQAGGSGASWHGEGRAVLKGQDGTLDFTLQHKDGHLLAHLAAQQLGDWPAFVNLSSIAWPDLPVVRGDGTMAGAIELDLADGQAGLTFDLDADRATIRHPLLEKQAGTAAQCRGEMRWSNAGMPSAVRLDHCTLHRSGVETLAWQLRQTGHQLSVRGLHLDFDALQEQHIRLPGLLRGLHGKLAGDFASFWQTDDKGRWPWTRHADATLNMQGFGSDSWQTDGAIQASRGVFAAGHLHIQGLHGNAELKGSFDFSRNRGRIDILGGVLDWQDMPAPAGDWHSIELAGSIRQGRLRLLDNTWKEIRAGYRLHEGRLRLDHVAARLAGGDVSSPDISLRPAADGLHIDGKLRAAGIDPAGVTGLRKWLNARLAGRLHANLLLHGRLPARDMRAWQGSNGDLLIYNGRWQPLAPDTATETHDYRFRSLQGRFRILKHGMRWRAIRLTSRDGNYSGKAWIDRRGRISGFMESGEHRYRLQGAWPNLSWSATP